MKFEIFKGKYKAGDLNPNSIKSNCKKAVLKLKKGIPSATIATLLIFISSFAYSQTYRGTPVKFDVDKWNITATISKPFNDQQAQEFFKFIDQVFGRSLKDRYLITKTGTYYRAGISRNKPKKIKWEHL